MSEHLVRSVGIIGTGDFAKALGNAFLKHDFSVTFGSRRAEKRKLEGIDETFTNYKCVSIRECIKSSDVVFLSIHADHHYTLKEYADDFNGKIVIDVSNPRKVEKDTPSVAEKLSKILPEAKIVKAFNTLSAYGVSSETSGESKMVYVCGNDIAAKHTVLQLARSCGFVAVDKGSLSSAKQLETMPLSLCRDWGFAMWVTLFVSVFWFIYTLLRYYVFRENPYTWERLPLNVMNKFFGEVGLMLLAFCYLPGCITAFIQLCNGTKYKRFPSFLDSWLKSRKYMGLLALLMSSMHTVMSMTILNPAYFGDFYKSTSNKIDLNKTDIISVPLDSRMSWMGESSVSCGFMGMALMAILGITSIPAIGNLMNWKQWNFVHTHMGFLCLLLCTAHVTIKGAYSWVDETAAEILPSMAFLGSFIPWIVLFLRLILYIPFVASRLGRIRRGWDTATKYQAEGGSKVGTEVYANGNSGFENGSTDVTGL